VLKRGTKEEDNPFIPRSLARSPVNRNNDEEEREIDIDTPSEYSEQSDYNTPMVVKSKRRNEPLIKTAMRRHNNNNNKIPRNRDSEEEMTTSQLEMETKYTVKQAQMNVLFNILTQLILNANQINSRLHLLSKKYPDIAKIAKENNGHMSETSE
jgi:hypothetical protein